MLNHVFSILSSEFMLKFVIALQQFYSLKRMIRGLGDVLNLFSNFKGVRRLWVRRGKTCGSVALDWSRTCKCEFIEFEFWIIKLCALYIGSFEMKLQKSQYVHWQINYAIQTTSYWSIYTSTKKEKGIRSFRNRRATGNWKKLEYAPLNPVCLKQ